MTLSTCLVNLPNNLSEQLPRMDAPIQSQLSDARKHHHWCIEDGKHQ